MDKDLMQLFFQEGMRRLLADASPEEVQEWAAKELQKMVAKGDGRDMLDIPESITFYEQLLQQREDYLSQPADARLDQTYPWGTWNGLIDPLPPGMLMTLAGEDGAGKTTYAECLTEWYAKNRNKVVYFHFELSHTVMMDRRSARWTNMTIRQLKGQLSPEERATVRKVNAFIGQWQGNIQYVHCPGWSMEQVVQRARALRAEGKCDIVVVDYLEKAQASPKQLRAFGQNLYQREADNVELLKNMAEQLEVPVIMLAQLNKEGKTTDFADMERTAIRGAGEKTERANVVVMLHRNRLDSGAYENIVNVRVAKNTLGATGDFKQWMRPENFKVGDGDIRSVSLDSLAG